MIQTLRAAPLLVALLLVAAADGADRPLVVNALPGVTLKPGAPDLGSDTANVDAIFDAMTAVVAVADTAKDVACAEGLQVLFPELELPALAFRREGELRPLEPRTDVDGESRRLAFSHPGATVVEMILNCGSLQPAAGCGELGGDSFLVVRQSSLVLDGALWAHEYAHLKGLRHRDERGALMRSILYSNNQELTADECLAVAGLVAPPRSGAPGEVASVGSELTKWTLDELVRGVHIHGMPFVSPSELTRRDVAQLTSMLLDPRESEHRQNVALLLGMVGGAREEALLMDFVARAGSGALSWADAREVVGGMFGLGYLAHRIGSARGLALLEDAAATDYWALDSPDMARALTSAAVFGLAVSGRAEAWRALTDLRAEPQNEAMAGTIEHALGEHVKVVSGGLAGYYGRR